MEFGLFDGGEDAELTSVGFVEISNIFVMQDDFFDGEIQFDGVECVIDKWWISPSGDYLPRAWNFPRYFHILRHASGAKCGINAENSELGLSVSLISQTFALSAISQTSTTLKFQYPKLLKWINYDWWSIVPT